MIIYIYYTLGIFVFLYNLKYLTNVSEFSNINKWVEAFRKVNSKIPSKEEILIKDPNLLYSYNYIYVTMEIFWFCLGILTNDWILCLIGFIISYFTKTISNKYVLGISYSLKMCLVLFLIVNGVHFNFNTYLIIVEFFSNLL